MLFQDILLYAVQDTLTTPVSAFGSKCEISDAFIEKLYKSGLVDKALELLFAADDKILSKNDGGLRKTVRVPKAEDAILAGSGASNRGETCLILTEGLGPPSHALHTTLFK